MPQSLSQVYVHIVFSTKYRQKLIDSEIKDRLFEYLGGICNGIKCQPIQIGGHEDHVHVLCRMSRIITMASLVEELKKRSSSWIKTIDDKYSNFYWQRGYGIFSVDWRGVDIVINYIKNQEEHHKPKNFKEEFLELLNEFDIEYDERYMWD